MPKRTTISRYQDISCGHRVSGHGGKCAALHGHNYRITFTVSGEEKNELGMVVDFSDVKEVLCKWLEDNWDHKFLIFFDDPLLPAFKKFAAEAKQQGVDLGLVSVGFNPTAEMIAEVLLDMGHSLLTARHLHDGAPKLTLESVRVEETRKCSATARRVSHA